MTSFLHNYSCDNTSIITALMCHILYCDFCDITILEHNILYRDSCDITFFIKVLVISHSLFWFFWRHILNRYSCDITSSVFATRVTWNFHQGSCHVTWFLWRHIFIAILVTSHYLYWFLWSHHPDLFLLPILTQNFHSFHSHNTKGSHSERKKQQQPKESLFNELELS